MALSGRQGRRESRVNTQSKCDDLALPPQPALHRPTAPGLFLSGLGRDDAGLARKTLPELPPKKVKSSQTPARLGALSTEACIPQIPAPTQYL